MKELTAAQEKRRAAKAHRRKRHAQRKEDNRARAAWEKKVADVRRTGVVTTLEPATVEIVEQGFHRASETDS